MSGAIVGPVGDQVRRNALRLRLERGLTKKDVADRARDLGCPIPPLGVSRIEAGTRRVDADDLVVLAAVLGVTVQQLLDAPTECGTCQGTPPSGFACLACGAGGDGARADGEVPRRRRRNSVTEQHLREVTEVYQEAVAEGAPPTVAVAERLGASHSTAARWVGMARAGGFLGAASRGRSGEGR